MSYLEHCRYRGFDGVILACVNFYDAEVMELVRSDIPTVTIDHLFNNVCAVVSDNIKGIQDLLHYVYDKGHRRIAYIHGADSAVTQKRLSSFYKTAAELGLDVPDEYIRTAAYRDTQGAYAETEKLLDLKRRPTCIFYPDDFACYGGMNAIHERGLRVPDDISVVSTEFGLQDI